MRYCFRGVLTAMCLCDIFKPDNLHMNEKGYAIWTQAVKPVLIHKELPFERRE